MTTADAFDAPSRHDLARRYANGDLTIHELRRAGHWRMFELMSDLADLDMRAPLADMVGPNVATRRAGLERLEDILRP